MAGDVSITIRGATLTVDGEMNVAGNIVLENGATLLQTGGSIEAGNISAGSGDVIWAMDGEMDIDNYDIGSAAYLLAAEQDKPSGVPSEAVAYEIIVADDIEANGDYIYEYYAKEGARLSFAVSAGADFGAWKITAVPSGSTPIDDDNKYERTISFDMPANSLRIDFTPGWTGDTDVTGTEVAGSDVSITEDIRIDGTLRVIGGRITVENGGVLTVEGSIEMRNGGGIDVRSGGLLVIGKKASMDIANGGLTNNGGDVLLMGDVDLSDATGSASGRWLIGWGMDREIPGKDWYEVICQLGDLGGDVKTLRYDGADHHFVGSGSRVTVTPKRDVRFGYWNGEVSPAGGRDPINENNQYDRELKFNQPSNTLRVRMVEGWDGSRIRSGETEILNGDDIEISKAINIGGTLRILDGTITVTSKGSLTVSGRNADVRFEDGEIILRGLLHLAGGKFIVEDGVITNRGDALFTESFNIGRQPSGTGQWLIGWGVRVRGISQNADTWNELLWSKGAQEPAVNQTVGPGGDLYEMKYDDATHYFAAPDMRIEIDAKEDFYFGNWRVRGYFKDEIGVGDGRTQPALTFRMPDYPVKITAMEKELPPRGVSATDLRYLNAGTATTGNVFLSKADMSGALYRLALKENTNKKTLYFMIPDTGLSAVNIVIDRNALRWARYTTAHEFHFAVGNFDYMMDMRTTWDVLTKNIDPDTGLELERAMPTHYLQRLPGGPAITVTFI